MDRYDLYELAANAPSLYVRFLEAVHGGAPAVLREDFSGSGAIARAWAGGAGGGGRARRAVCVDRDPQALAALIARCGRATLRRITVCCADVMEAEDRADVIAALNFAVGYWHTRAELLAYCRRARGRLRRGGTLVVDMYGGPTAFRPGRYSQRLRGPGAVAVTYTWEQREADPISARVRNAMHFSFVAGRGSRAKRTTMRDAFTYHWRLWSAAELREAMLDAGFERVDVYTSLGGAVDGEGRLHVRPAGAPGEGAGWPADAPEGDYVVYVAGRA